MKHVLLELKSTNHTAYVKNRCVSESDRSISDVIKIFDLLDIPGYLVTMDVEKTFDSLDHCFKLSIFFKKMVLVKISFIG